MASMMSVDEYVDELIDRVHQDYANLFFFIFFFYILPIIPIFVDGCTNHGALQEL
jgi:hypothetical protein